MTTGTTEVHRPTAEHLREARRSHYLALAIGACIPFVIMLGRFLAQASKGNTDIAFSNFLRDGICTAVPMILFGLIAFLYRGRPEHESLKTLRYLLEGEKLIRDVDEVRSELDLKTVTKVSLSQDYAGKISSLILHTGPSESVALGGLERVDALYQQIKLRLCPSVDFNYTMTDVPLLGSYMRVVIFFVLGVVVPYFCYLYFG